MNTRIKTIMGFVTLARLLGVRMVIKKAVVDFDFGAQVARRLKPDFGV
jgi:hypothetical protein